MTVIIGSLFLPYTVQFDVETDSGAATEPRTTVTASRSDETAPVARSVPTTQTSRLTATSYQTPTLSPHSTDRSAVVHETGESVEEFFLKKIGDASQSGMFTENMKQTVVSQYGQPKSTVVISKRSVVEFEKAKDELARPEPPKATERDTNKSETTTSGATMGPVSVGMANSGSAGGIPKSSLFDQSPWKVVMAAKGNGSLIKAVKLAAEDGTIHSRKWVGTLAIPTDEVSQTMTRDIATTLSQDYNCEAIFPSNEMFAGHYKSFCKQMLWPTFHYENPDNPKSKAFEDDSWRHYKALNQLMADNIVQVYKKENGELDGDDVENIIWIHDYHLLLVPQMIREQLPQAKIGLFLHVSFPSSEVFRCLAQREALLKGMLGANTISFQTNEYVRHFLQTCSRLLLADANEYGLTYEARFTMVNTIPAGVDVGRLGDQVRGENVAAWRKRIRQRWDKHHLIVSRDKVNKLRGIKEKLLAYERFLRAHPQFVDNTVLIQVCIESDLNDDYMSQIITIVSRINALPPNMSVSQPVVLLQQDINFDQYIALQAEADAFVVSCMREGLNLTCHEFIIATTENKSPLMLSEFTGSSQLLDCGGQGPLLINPWDISHFAETFYTALTMAPDQKLRRWRNCHDVVCSRDHKHWITHCLLSINDAWTIEFDRNTRNVLQFNKTILRQFLRQTHNTKRLFVINLETAPAITSLGNDFKNVANPLLKTSDILSPVLLYKHLEDVLFMNDDNLVFICSHLKRSTLDTLFKRFPKVGLVAENGGYIKHVGSHKWISLVNEQELANWMPQLTQIVQAKVERLPGSRCEVKDCTIVFHPGSSFKDDRDRCVDLMGDLIQHVQDVFDENAGIHASLIWNSVVVQPNHLSSRCLNYLVNYYNNQSVNDFHVSELSSPRSFSPSLGPEEHFVKAGNINGLFVSGGTTLIDEPVYELAHNMLEQRVVGNVITVASFSTDPKATFAKYRVSGRNELLGIFKSSLS